MFRTGLIYAFKDWHDAQIQKEGNVMFASGYDPEQMKIITREYRVVCDGEFTDESGKVVRRKFWEFSE